MPQKHNQDATSGDKLLALYQRLTLDSRKIFQTDLAEELECSPQTISRLITVIERNLGGGSFIEVGIENRRRYYQLRSLSEDRSFGFSFDELRYLAICRDLAGHLLPKDVSNRIGKTLSNLAIQMGEGYGPNAVAGGIGFRSKGYIDYEPHLKTISVLREAMQKKKVCRVEYRARGKSHQYIYRYAPGVIISMNGTLYAHGYLLDEDTLMRGRATTFSVHRISKVMETGEFFNFNANDEPATGFGLRWHSPKRVRVQVQAEAADYVRDRIWSDDQVIEEQDDGGIIIEITTTSEKELNSWVCSFNGLAKLV